jgi:putative transposase
VRDLIRQMSMANSLWGAPRIHGELLKLGIDVSQATVSKYMVKPEHRPSQSWRTFLMNHASDIVSIDFFTVPTARWTGQQIVEAFPWDTAPSYLIRDRDGKFGHEFNRRVSSLEIEQILTSPHSPWQNPYVERVIGSIRRECLDHVIVLNERHLRSVLRDYPDYYHRSRSHLGLGKDCPETRAVEMPGIGPGFVKTGSGRTASSVLQTSCLIARPVWWLGVKDRYATKAPFHPHSYNLHGIGTQAAPVFANICGSKIVDEIKSVGGWNK